MFTTNHFIWLAISVAAIAGLLVYNKLRGISYDTVLNIAAVGSVISECVKIFSNMVEGYGGGMHLDPGDLPFHLCSIQIFLIFYLKYFAKEDKTRERLLGFMIPTMLLGATMALFIPTVGVKFTNPQVYQYFFFHAMLVFFSIYMIGQKIVHWSVKTLLSNLRYVGAVVFIATIINSTLYSGHETVNFLYLVRPPMDGLPILNLDNGWYAYIAALFTVALTLFGGLHAVLIAVERKFFKNR